MKQSLDEEPPEISQAEFRKIQFKHPGNEARYPQKIYMQKRKSEYRGGPPRYTQFHVYQDPLGGRVSRMIKTLPMPPDATPGMAPEPSLRRTGMREDVYDTSFVKPSNYYYDKALKEFLVSDNPLFDTYSGKGNLPPHEKVRHRERALAMLNNIKNTEDEKELSLGVFLDESDGLNTTWDYGIVKDSYNDLVYFEDTLRTSLKDFHDPTRYNY